MIYDNSYANYAFVFGYIFTNYNPINGLYRFIRQVEHGEVGMYFRLDQVERFLVHE